MLLCPIRGWKLLFFSMTESCAGLLTEGGPWGAVGRLSVEISESVAPLQRQWSQLQALWAGCLPHFHPLRLGGQVQRLAGLLHKTKIRQNRRRWGRAWIPGMNAAVNMLEQIRHTLAGFLCVILIPSFSLFIQAVLFYLCLRTFRANGLLHTHAHLRCTH